MRPLKAARLATDPWIRCVKSLFLFIVAAGVFGFAQNDNGTDAASQNALGSHNNSGRGCTGCHLPHSTDAVHSPASWAAGQSGNALPFYGPEMLFGDAENYVRVQPTQAASAGEEIAGVLLCLSCHDGNITPQNMMASQSYVRKMGLRANSGRGVPTLLSTTGEPGESTLIDHPLGPDVSIPLSGGLTFSNGTFSVLPGSAYARFVENYGFPSLAPGKRVMPYGVNRDGQPYLLCTTCHNQHLMTVYLSTASSPIAGDGGGHGYATEFFTNGPYSQKFDTVPSTQAPSTAQFCRQCHFALANEGNNALNVRTATF